jgi:hypothetical protein
LTFIILRSCSARLLVKGASKSVRKRRVSVWKVFSLAEEMANLRLGHALADALVNLSQFLRLLSHPGDDAGRTDQRRADEIAQRLRGPVFGDELLDIEIDRRRLEALAICVRRNHGVWGNGALLTPRQCTQR